MNNSMNPRFALYHLPSKNPFVTMKVYFRTGPRYENLNDRGLSHVIEHIVSDSFEEKISKSSSLPRWVRSFSLDNFRASTHFEFCSYEVSIEKEAFWKSANALLDSFTPRKVSDSFLLKQKSIVASEAHESQQANGFSLAAKRLHFQGSALERRFDPNQKYLEKIKPNDVFQYWKQAYQSGNCAVLVSGNLTKSEILKLEKLFLKKLPIQTQNSLSLPEDFKIDLGKNILHISPDSLPGTSIEASFLRPTTKPYDILLAQFSMYLLGEYFEYQLREAKNILYSVNTNVIAGSDFSYNSLSLDSPASSLKVAQALYRCLKSFPRAITKDNFFRILENHNLALSKQVQNQGTFLCMLESFISLPTQSIPYKKADYLRLAKSLTFSDFQSFAQSLSRHFNISIAGKISKSSIKALAEKMGLAVVR